VKGLEADQAVREADERRKEAEARVARFVDEAAAFQKNISAQAIVEAKLRETISTLEGQLEDHKKEETRLRQEFFRLQGLADERELALQSGRRREQHLSEAIAGIEQRLNAALAEGESRQTALYDARGQIQMLDLELKGLRKSEAALDDEMKKMRASQAEVCLDVAKRSEGKLQDALSHTEERLQEARQWFEERLQETEGRARERLAQRDSDIAQLKGQLDQKQLDLGQRDEALGHKDVALAKAKAKLAAAEADLSVSEARVSEFQATLGQTQESLHGMKESLSRSSSDLSQTREELGQIQFELNVARDELGRTKTELDKSNGTLNTTTAVLQKAQSELDVARDELSVVRGEVCEVRAALVAAKAAESQMATKVAAAETAVAEAAKKRPPRILLVADKEVSTSPRLPQASLLSSITWQQQQQQDNKEQELQPPLPPPQQWPSLEKFEEVYTRRSGDIAASSPLPSAIMVGTGSPPSCREIRALICSYTERRILNLQRRLYLWDAWHQWSWRVRDSDVQARLELAIADELHTSVACKARELGLGELLRVRYSGATAESLKRLVLEFRHRVAASIAELLPSSSMDLVESRTVLAAAFDRGRRSFGRLLNASLFLYQKLRALLPSELEEPLQDPLSRMVPVPFYVLPYKAQFAMRRGASRIAAGRQESMGKEKQQPGFRPAPSKGEGHGAFHAWLLARIEELEERLPLNATSSFAVPNFVALLLRVRNEAAAVSPQTCTDLKAAPHEGLRAELVHMQDRLDVLLTDACTVYMSGWRMLPVALEPKPPRAPGARRSSTLVGAVAADFQPNFRELRLGPRHPL